jgi:polyhydroxyalkanoate synthesis regulator phasin
MAAVDTHWKKGGSVRTIITAAIAAVLLFAGALAATAVIGGQATAQEGDDAPTEELTRPHPGALLQETLDELVVAGTITQAQADAITDALAAKVEEHRGEIQAWRDQRRDQLRDARHEGFFLGRYLDDGVVDAAELDEIMSRLPDDHWLKDPNGPAAPYLEDDQLTVDELRQLHDDLHQLRREDAQDSSA